MPARPPHRHVVTLAAGVVLAVVAPTAAAADAPQDPPGNNGTIKIDPYGETDGHANHPHPGCDFRLQLFGFDDEQTGSITFTGQAPTRGAVTKQPLAGTQLLSDDGAGGGKDVDAHFDVHGADLGLTGQPAKQGFHIKVLVDADAAPGGAKSKVFWLSCPTAPVAAAAPIASDTSPGTTTTAPTTTSSTASTAGTSSTTVQGVVSGASTADTAAFTEDTELLSTSRASAVRAAFAAADASAATAGIGTTRSTGRTGARDGLPFTGLEALALLGLGLVVLAAGGLAVVAGRRRTAS